LKKARFWIGILISIVALVFAFRQVDFQAVWEALLGVNYWLLVASLVPLVLFLVLRAFRWRLLFYPNTGLHVRNLFAVINVGYLLSNVFPARLGDVARAYLIGDTEEVSRAAAFSTIVTERVLDALSAVIALLVVMIFVDFPPPSPDAGPEAQAFHWVVSYGPYIVGAAGLALVVILAILSRVKEQTLALLRRLLRPFPRLDHPRLYDLVGSLIDGFAALGNPRLGPRLILWAAIIWIDITLYYWIVLLAFDPDQPLVAALAFNSITALGMTVPSSPGALGVFEALGRETMTFFGMTPEAALSYTLVAHAIVYVVFSILGLVSMVQQNLTYAEIQERISTEAQTST
jgi:uncharacterized protein (TIRG00374 family)